ncbi:hypothetical protein GBA52_008787 [Prunus armeniaca]|nr:hypothetical protein GBA52_008787 [Prunus armeniaca]
MDLGLQHIQLELDAQAAIWMAFQCDADLGYEGVLGRATLNLYVEDKLHKATPGGTGGVKSITNYSPAASSSFMQVISFSVGFDGLGWAYAPLPTQNKAKLATHD